MVSSLDSDNLGGTSEEPPVNSPTVPPAMTDQQPSTSHSSLSLGEQSPVSEAKVIQLLNGEFVKHVCNKAIKKMKKITGFDAEKTYSGKDLDAMFTTMSLSIENYHSKYLEGVLHMNRQNSSDFSDIQSASNSSNPNKREVEKLLDDSETLQGGDSYIQNEPISIDVDNILLNQLGSPDFPSDDSTSSDQNVDDVLTSSNDNKVRQNSDKKKSANSDNISIPDIEKELDSLKNKNNREDSYSSDCDSEIGETPALKLEDNIDDKKDTSSVTDDKNEENVSLDMKDAEASPRNADCKIVMPYHYSYEENTFEDFFETCVNEKNKFSNESLEEDVGKVIDCEHTDFSKKSIDGNPQNDSNKCDDNLISEDESDDCTPKKTNKKLGEMEKLVKENNRLVDSSSDDDFKADVEPKRLNSSTANKNDESDDEISSRRKSRKNFIFNSDDEDSRNDNENKDDSSSDSSENLFVKTKKRKLKRVVRMSDEESADGKSNSSGSDSDARNKSRKKLKKIQSPDRRTRDAEKNERERRKRIEEKQKLYNQLVVQENKEQSERVNQVVLDFDKESKQILVEVNKNFVEHLKPHQVDGIKFLFNCTIESIERLTKHNHSSGCVLAHSMGLGKTFQVISFLHTIMTNPLIKDIIKCVLIIVPLNVVRNWANEFDDWFEKCRIEQKILLFKHFYNDKTLDARKDTLKKWKQQGGILLCTNTVFNNCLKAKKKYGSAFKECLVDPGPDMVIIDEGHLLKNDQGVFNKNLSQIKTLRRVILTGTPLQNNLSEYYTMVSFVKPNLLGTKREFKNRFENPIKNGEHCDSTAYDVQMMKKRVHILNKLLKDCIHRCDYSVLVPYLQPKFEYVLSLRLTELQEKLYKYYLENVARKSEFQHFFADYTRLGYIWNHPALLERHYRKQNNVEDEGDEEEDSMDGFIVYGSSSESSAESDHSDALIKKEKDGSVKSKEDSPEVDSEIELVFERHCKNGTTGNDLLTEHAGNEKKDEFKWIEKFLPENLLDLNLSSKFILLFSILEKCEIIGDKILIFSQSLTTLDLIEDFLKIKMDEHFEKYGPIDDEQSYEEVVAKTGGFSHCWIKDKDYFRIDGNVNCDFREGILDHFNDPEKHRARLLLISTKAGGIGINLVGANRCVIFDASWNPANDMQAIFRIFRYGQLKPVYVYRFTASGTMENKIYERQILKQSLSHRVIDERQIQRHFKAKDANELYHYYGPDECRKVPEVPKDNLLADVYQANKDLILNCHEHDSLLENRPEEGLTEEERKIAWTEYENEKERGVYPGQNFAPFPSAYLDTMNTQHRSPFLNQHQLRQQFGPSTSYQFPQGNNPYHPANFSNLFSLYNRQFAQPSRPVFQQEQQHHLPQQQHDQLQLQHQRHQHLQQNLFQNPQFQNPQFQNPQFQNSQFQNQHLSLLQHQQQYPQQRQNQQQQHKNAHNQRKSLMKSEKQTFDEFLIHGNEENQVLICEDWICNLNLCKIAEFETKSYSAFYEEFKDISPFKYTGNDVQYRTYMLLYLEKLLLQAYSYRKELKEHIKKDPSASPTFYTIVKSISCINMIYKELKNLNSKDQLNYLSSFSMRNTNNINQLYRLRKPGINPGECITISDDDEPK